MPFGALLAGVDRLLHPEGIFSLILPWQESAGFVGLALACGMYPIKITTVQSKPGRPPKRSMLAFGRKKVCPERDSLLVYAGCGGYSAAFRKLTDAFYLNL